MKKEPIRRKHTRPLARLLLPALWLLLLACEKKDPLPKATQEGRNIFGCKIDGKPWVPDGGTGFQATKPVRGGFFSISTYPVLQTGIYVRAVSKDKQEIQIFLNGNTTGEYILNRDTRPITIGLMARDYGFYRKGTMSYITSKEFTGKIIVTKADTATGVVAGTFEFVAGNPQGDKVTVTDGRFDVNVRTQ